jgi:hypothetical protein
VVKRSRSSARPFRELGLYEKLAAIGVMVTASPLSQAEIQRVDIEEALVDATTVLGRGDDLKLLGPMLSWVAMHGSAIIIEKLLKILRQRKDGGDDVEFVGLYALVALQHGHKRWSIIAERFGPDPAKPRPIGPIDLNESLLRLRGEEEWSKGSGFLVPKGSAAINQKWVLSRPALAKQHRQYRNRLMYGAQWRADIVTAYESGARTPAEASRMTGASYEPCYRVKSELEAAGVLTVTRKTS